LSEALIAVNPGRKPVLTFQLKTITNLGGRHKGEVFGCAYAPDARYVLSAGWDGRLRLWDGAAGTPTAEFQATTKPLSACAVSPDGQSFWTGCLDGFLTQWDASSRKQRSSFVAHARPISAIVFGAGGRLLATASWDRNLTIWDLRRERDGRVLAGHRDIVAGCQFTPDGQQLLSWSHDNTLALWDVAACRRLAHLRGHADRVTAAAISPDGRWAASGSSNRTLKLWSLPSCKPQGSQTLADEIQACMFLLDGVSLVVIDKLGRVSVHCVPDLELTQELHTALPTQSAALAPTGSQIALGCVDGQVRLLGVEGFDRTPLLVPATRTSRRTATALQRLFGQSRLVESYHCTCPVCGQAMEFSHLDPIKPRACTNCRRDLRIGDVVLVGHDSSHF
jgi:WD40 repeat protein